MYILTYQNLPQTATQTLSSQFGAKNINQRLKEQLSA